jgi:uncharacterized phage protein (TIGR01671 family)
MREIKFRVFSKDRMFIIESDSDFTLQFGNNKPMLAWYSNSGEFIEEWAVDNLMQYTGLKDKNGKEIYEGDIIKNGGGRICVVEWHQPTAGFDSKFMRDTVMNPAIDKSYGFQCNMWEMHVEVIGNIYENPELLEAK